MKKLVIGIFTLTLLSEAAFARSYECEVDQVYSKEQGYTYVKTENEVISIDTSLRYDNLNDEKTAHMVYQIKINDETIRRKAYLNKKQAKNNDAGFVNSYDEEYSAKITDQINATKVTLSLDILDTSLRGKISNIGDSNETIRIFKNCQEFVLKGLK